MRRSSFVLIVTVLFTLSAARAAEHKNISGSDTTYLALPGAPATRVAMEPRFLGLYAADGHYKSLARDAKSLATDVEPVDLSHGRPGAVPPFVDLHSSEAVVEDLAPPARPRKAMKGKSGLAHLRDSIITAAYGRGQVLISPTLVTTDSRQRLIIADPLEPSVHVLDGANSFRIEGGPAHRLLHPNGLAVDSHDNIYVSDGQLDHILVYNSDGQFLRTIGDFRGESMFQGPTSIAIDHTTDLLYVLDSPLNEIVVLDLTGRAVKRIGGIHSRNTDVKLDLPTAIAVANNAIVVLDTHYSRIVVLDRDGSLHSEFAIRPVRLPALAANVGVALDNAGNIYTSHPETATVRIYTPSGELIGSLRGTTLPNARLTSPTGIWVDSSDHIFVADPTRSAVQVFQAYGPKMIHNHRWH